MAEYETKQRRILLDYLNAHPDQGFSVEELYEGLSAEHAACRVNVIARGGSVADKAVRATAK